jgi:hypothetical protein
MKCVVCCAVAVLIAEQDRIPLLLTDRMSEALFTDDDELTNDVGRKHGHEQRALTRQSRENKGRLVRLSRRVCWHDRVSVRCESGASVTGTPKGASNQSNELVTIDPSRKNVEKELGDEREVERNLEQTEKNEKCRRQAKCDRKDEHEKQAAEGRTDDDVCRHLQEKHSIQFLLCATARRQDAELLRHPSMNVADGQQTENDEKKRSDDDIEKHLHEQKQLIEDGARPEKASETVALVHFEGDESAGAPQREQQGDQCDQELCHVLVDQFPCARVFRTGQVSIERGDDNVIHGQGRAQIE